MERANPSVFVFGGTAYPQLVKVPRLAGDLHGGPFGDLSGAAAVSATEASKHVSETHEHFRGVGRPGRAAQTGTSNVTAVDRLGGRRDHRLAGWLG